MLVMLQHSPQALNKEQILCTQRKQAACSVAYTEVACSEHGANTPHALCMHYKARATLHAVKNKRTRPSTGHRAVRRRNRSLAMVERHRTHHVVDLESNACSSCCGDDIVPNRPAYPPGKTRSPTQPPIHPPEHQPTHYRSSIRVSVPRTPSALAPPAQFL